MTKKEKMELLLAKVPEEQKAAFVGELRKTKTMGAYLEVAKKYNLHLSGEEKGALRFHTNEVADEELDMAAGGCCNPNCGCSIY